MSSPSAGNKSGACPSTVNDTCGITANPSQKRATSTSASVDSNVHINDDNSTDLSSQQEKVDEAAPTSSSAMLDVNRINVGSDWGDLRTPSLANNEQSQFSRVQKTADLVSPSLLQACDEGLVDVVMKLLEEGADHAVTDQHGRTALMSASEKGHTEIVSILLQHGASVDMADEDGWTALMSASEKGHTEITEIVSILLQHGASVDMADEDGWTALMSASEKGHTEVVRTSSFKGGCSSFTTNDVDLCRTPSLWEGGRLAL